MIAYRREIDGLRAIAITSVVLFHTGISAFSGGYVGVDIFFVISGYLITSLILKAEAEGGFSYIDFYVRRARRILPALLFMILIVSAACYWLFLPRDLIEYGKILIYTVLMGANFRLAGSRGYFDQSMQENPLLHMWSLSVEEQFYLIWPTLLLLMLAFLARKQAVKLTLALALVSLATAEICVQVWPKSAFFHLPSRGWELLAGAILAMGIVPPITNGRFAEFLARAGLFLMLVPVFIYDISTRFPGLAALPPVLGCTLVIHAEKSFRTKVGLLLSYTPIVFIGLISYSLYLWHWPVFALASYAMMGSLSRIGVACCVAVTVLLAIISWHFVEKPFRRRPQTKSSSPFHSIPLPSAHLSRLGYIALVATALMVVSGSAFQETKGLPFRFEREFKALAMEPAAAPLPPACSIESHPMPGMTECRFGDANTGGSAEVVLWGDSHAGHYVRTVSSVYGRGTAYISPACMPLPGVQWVTKAGYVVNKYCDKMNAYALSNIFRLKPKVVLMAGRWTTSEHLPYGREARPDGILLVSNAEPRTREHSREVFALQLRKTVARLTSAGIKVVLMGQAPEMGVSVPECMVLSRSLGREAGRCKSIARSEVERRQFYVNKALSGIASDDANVSVFWPMSSLCDGERCYSVRDGKVLYTDGDHLNEAGSLALAGALKSSLSHEFLPSRTYIATAGGG